MVLALNMMDEVRNNGGSINVKEMSRLLGIPIIPISAIRNEGVGDLIHTAYEVAEINNIQKSMIFVRQARCIAVYMVCIINQKTMPAEAG